MKDTNWKSSDVVTVNNNKFQSHLASLKDINEIKEKLDVLIDSNKKILKASHKHIYAYNIPSKNKFGFNDDGEAGAGEHLLKVLRQYKPQTDQLLAVTRWNKKKIKLRQQKVSNNTEMRSFSFNLVNEISI
jgi:hypothetical protein